jgi:hypothetical protein
MAAARLHTRLFADIKGKITRRKREGEKRKGRGAEGERRGVRSTSSKEKRSRGSGMEQVRRI